MASNALANISAATTAGYVEIVLDRGVLTQAPGSQQAPLPRFQVKLEGQVVGQPGASGSRVEFIGEGATQAASETVALANLNAWRANRYGSDSAGVNTGTLGVAPATPSTQGQPVTLVSLTKDKH
jgi:hypothetical protein